MAEKVTIYVGGTPEGEGKVGCACDDLPANDWKRCEKHSAMMRAIGEVYHGDSSAPGWSRVVNAISEHADGYGEPGFCPDWSAYRDSSAYAVEQMYAALLAHS